MSALTNLRPLVRLCALVRRVGRDSGERRWRHALRRPVVAGPTAVALLGAVAIVGWLGGWLPAGPVPEPVAGPAGVPAPPRLAFASLEQQVIILRAVNGAWSTLAETATARQPQAAAQPSGRNGHLTYVTRSGRRGDLSGDVWFKASPTSAARKLNTRGNLPAAQVAEPDVNAGGSQVVYSALRDGHWEIWVTGTDGSGAPRQLTHDNATATWPRWSPDGSKIAFVSTREDPAGDIYTMPASGGTPTRVTRTPSADTQPAWSPNGRNIAFTTDRWRATTDVAVIPATGGKTVRLASGREPVWSPANDAVYYISTPLTTAGKPASQSGRLFSVPVTDPVTANPTPVQVDLGAGALAAGGERHPTFASGSVNSLAVAVDLAPAAATYDSYFDVWTTLFDGTRVTDLTNVPGRAERAPMFSPDGNKIAYEEDRYDGAAFVGRGITIANQDGTNPQALTSGKKSNGTGVQDHDPAWSPDGRLIAFSRQDAGSRSIVVAAVSDGSIFQLGCPELCTDGEPTWSPDGRTIVFTRYLTSLPMDLKGGLDTGNTYDRQGQLSGRSSVPVAAGPLGSGGYPLESQDLWSVPVVDGRSFGTAVSIKHDVFPIDPSASPGTMPSHTDWGPAFAPAKPNGARTLVYVQDDFLVQATLNASGNALTNATVLLEGGSQHDGDLEGFYDPTYSPDGGTIVFSAFVVCVECEGWSDAALYAIPAAGGDPTLVVDNLGDDVEPSYQPSADLAVTVGANPSSISVQMTSTITAVVANTGYVAAPNAAATLTIPDGLRATAIRSSAGVACDLTALRCPLGTVASGARVTVTLEVTAQRTGTQEVSASASSSQFDPDTSDNTARTSIIVGDEADVSVTMSVAPATGYVGGDPIVVTYTVTNRGGFNATQVKLSTVLPPELPVAKVEITPTADGRQCATPFKDCTLGTIPPADVEAPANNNVVTVKVTLAPNAAVNVLGTGEVSADFDADPRNNTASAPIVVLAPTLVIAPKVGSPGFVPIAFGTNFPPGAKIRLVWDRGITWRTRNLITVNADGTFRAPMIVFHKDVLGKRTLQASPDASTPAGTAFGRVGVDFIVVPGQDQPDEWLYRR